MKKEAVMGFRGDYYFLSNFSPYSFNFEGQMYLCSEAAFQAMKCREAIDRLPFCVMNGAQAKKAGRAVPLRADWEDIKVDVMRRVLRAKFTKPNLRAALLKTGNKQLMELNRHNDTYWGVVRDGDEVRGNNMLGLLLMELRDELANRMDDK